MKHIMSVGIVLAAFAFGWLGAMAAQDKKEVKIVDSAKVEFKELAPGASIATLWGDPNLGASGNFVKFEPGAKFDMHTHTSDMRLVVLKGAYVYKPEKGEERRISAGQYISLPGGDRHVSTGDAKDGALFYQETSGKFDIVFDKK